MKKSIYLFSLLCLMLGNTSFAQTKTNTTTKANTEEEPEKNNGQIIKVIGAADTLLDPSFLKLMVMKSYDPRQVDGDATTIFQSEISDMLRHEGIDNSKFTVVSLYSTPVEKKASAGVATFTVKVFDINKADNLAGLFSGKGYSITRFSSELDDNLVDFREIDKALLPRAIQSGKEKATTTATQLGVKNYSLQRFNEGGLKNKSTNARDAMNTKVEKIRLEKVVNLIYKID